MTTLLVDMTPILRICDYVRDEVGIDVGGVIQQGRATRLYKFAWIADINGLELGFETIDYSYTYGDHNISSPLSSIDERTYELSASGWAMDWRFLTNYVRGPFDPDNDDCLFLYRGKAGRVRRAMFHGDPERFKRDMFMMRVLLDTTVNYGRSKESWDDRQPERDDRFANPKISFECI